MRCRFQAVAALIAFALGALAILVLPGCGAARAHPPSHVAAGVEQHIGDVESTDAAAAVAHADAKLARTQAERDHATRIAAESDARRDAAERALITERDAEAKAAREAEDAAARARLFRDAIIASGLVALSLAIAYEFAPLRRIALTIALAGGGFSAFALELRALLWLVPWVGLAGALIAVIALFRHAQIGHAALEEMAKDSDHVQHAISGKVATAVAWLRDRIAWHHPSQPPRATIAAAVAATGTITKP